MKNKQNNTPPDSLGDTFPISTAPVEGVSGDDPAAARRDEDDEEAMLEAARHRQRASSMVRNHLESHVDNNPGSSSDYVTWIATLHPENAEITIDPRFFIPGNPHWTIYEETKNNLIPMATAVPIPNHSDDNNNDDDYRQNPSPHYGETGAVSAGSSSSNNNNENDGGGGFCKSCSPVSIAFGIMVGVPALFTVLALELVAFVWCYGLSTMFFYIARGFAPPNCCTCLFYYVFMLVHKVMRFVDSILLVVSVVVTEVLGFVACLVGFCTGGAGWASYLQQEIRRTCHGVRILFRKTSASSSTKSENSSSHPPPRTFFCPMEPTTTTPAGEERDEQQQQQRRQE